MGSSDANFWKSGFWLEVSHKLGFEIAATQCLRENMETKLRVEHGSTRRQRLQGKDAGMVDIVVDIFYG